ncbi:MAG: 50S ribosomal protein L18 [Candidatus Omnitrophota bacterium]|nr:50S ribosomal protein L18 [Candidatus Omnitrophota bacterium]
MNKNSDKKLNRIRRHKKVRAKISGTSSKPRIAVFKSNQYIYAQVVDDENGKTLLSVSDMEVKTGNKSDKALKIGETLAARMKEKGLLEAVFDRGGFKFHGRVKSVADGLRSGGIKF